MIDILDITLVATPFTFDGIPRACLAISDEVAFDVDASDEARWQVTASDQGCCDT